MRVVLLTFLFFFVFTRKPFKIGLPIKIYANHIGPIVKAPHQTYRYFDYAFCEPEKPIYKFPSIGEALQGDELVETLMIVGYRENIEKKQVICDRKLKKKDVKDMSEAIENEYWAQFMIDELPIYALLGKYDPATKRSFLYTSRHFTLAYNPDNFIVEINIEPRDPVLLKEGLDVEFSFTAEWIEKDIQYSRRFERYLDNKFFEHQIHWFSIINSFLMVLFLSGIMVMVVVRTIRSDLNETSDLPKVQETNVDLEQDGSKGKPKQNQLPDFDALLSFTETGWKRLSSDVFRAPSCPGFFAALIGTGLQLTILTFVMILCAIVVTFYDEPGTMMTTFVIFYVLTSVISGFASGSYYIQHKGENWIRTMVITSTFFPAVLIIGYGVMNFFAILYQSSQAIPFRTIGLIFCIHGFLTIPLICIGTILGRSFNSDPNFPSQPKVLKRQIPQKPLYANRIVIVFAGGILPFGSIFIELYFIFSSFQTYKIYYVYGFFLAVFVILLIVTICVSVVLTYILLISEDWRWPWTSFMSSASTGFYTFIYAFFFYQNTKMSGLFEFVFYITHCFLFSFTVSIICGAIGFFASYFFVRMIYRNMKYD